MLMAEYDYETDMEVQREEAQEEGFEKGFGQGHEQGRTEEKKNLIRKKLAKGKSPQTIADELEEDDLSVIDNLIKEIETEDNSQAG